jgi:hypothetical protein
VNRAGCEGHKADSYKPDCDWSSDSSLLMINPKVSSIRSERMDGRFTERVE